MRYRWIGAVLLLLALLVLLAVVLHLNPLRAGLACLLLYGGYQLVRSPGAPGPRTTLVGAVHLMDRDYPFQEIALACAMADVKIDLSRAIIPPGEHHITVRGLVGDVAIYVPYDLEVSVEASVPLGRLDLMGDAGRTGAFATAGYAEARNKVKIAVSLTMGDINVRYL